MSRNIIPLNDFKMALRSTLLYNIDPMLKISKADREANKNPFLALGYGINAYFNIIYGLMWCMTICFIAFLPVLGVYGFNHIRGL